MRFLRGRPGFLFGGTQSAGGNAGLGGETVKVENEGVDGTDAATDSTIVEEAK